jgi:hypothetical protein
MKIFIFILAATFSLNSNASGWLDLKLKKGSVFTKARDVNNPTSEGSLIAILRETKSNYPHENFECRLTLEDESQLKGFGKYRQDGSWTRFTLDKELYLNDGVMTYEVKLTPDNGSECVKWGPEYNDDGVVQRDCLQRKEFFKTMQSQLKFQDRRNGVDLTLSCEKWLSQEKLEHLDAFYNVISKVKSNPNLPVYLDAELD